eukprot:9302760-Pyramimonas_sp.AAC.1
MRRRKPTRKPTPTPSPDPLDRGLGGGRRDWGWGWVFAVSREGCRKGPWRVSIGSLQGDLWGPRRPPVSLPPF